MTSTQKKLLWGYVVGSLFLLLVAGIAIKHFAEKASEKTALASALTDTVHHYKTVNGLNAAYIQTVVADKATLVAVSAKKDSVIASLLKKNSNITDITHVQSTTSNDTTAKVDTEYVVKNGAKVKADSIYIDKSIINKWYSAQVSVRADSISLKIKTYDDFVIDHEFKSQGFLKPNLLDVNVINLNPNSVNTGLSSYQIAVPKPNYWLPAGGGAAAVIIFGILTHLKL